MSDDDKVDLSKNSDNDARIAGLLDERDNLRVRGDKDGLKVVEAELEARGHKDDDKAEQKRAEAERQAVHKSADEAAAARAEAAPEARSEPPAGRSAKPVQRG